MSKKGLSRRIFIQRALLAAGGLAGASWLGWRFLRPDSLPPIAGEIVGANSDVGHLLRKAVQVPISREVEEYDVLIVGAGIAGMSAGWKLQKEGITNYKILELHSQEGGNSVWDRERNAPWGAHYLPVPDPANHELVDLCRDLGMLEDYPGQDSPFVKTEHLCHDPQERLLLHGRWQDGLIPQFGVSEEERAQIARFFAEMETWKTRKGSDDKYAFDIPLDKSSRDEQFLHLDSIPFDEWMLREDYTSPALLWYVNYACRDDYGVPYSEVSAWAGLHYFAARRQFLKGSGNNEVMTWPEGNGRLADGLSELQSQNIRCNALVTELRNTETGVEAIWYDTTANVRHRVRAKTAIYAGPHFTVPYVCPDAPKTPLRGFLYAPWVVANVSLRKRPAGLGRQLSWDNVSYTSDSLGYVVADHQTLNQKPKDQVVISWYQPLDDRPPKEARTMALEMSWEQWTDRVLADLEGMHRGITADVERVDVWIWGHGMISPRTGFLWSGDREKAAAPVGKISFAHSDLSGISIFEEAFYQGLRAAGEVKVVLDS
jgi:hypothetical protein